MPQGVDDFTIVLHQLTDMVTCGVKAYDELDQLWRMVDRYKMTAPVAIKGVDNKARCVRAFRGNRHSTTGWLLEVKSARSPCRVEADRQVVLSVLYIRTS